MLSLSRPATAACFHILAFLVTVLAPVVAWVATKRIKASKKHSARLIGYRAATAFLLSASLAVFVLVPPAKFFEMPIPNRGANWLPSRDWISVLAILLAVITEVPLFLARRKGTFQLSFQRQVRELSGLLPRTRQERLWFCVAAVCAAIAEEVLYRGFLLNYLHIYPWRINSAASIAIGCVIFALAQLYLGAGRVLQSVLLALGLSVLFLSTRSLVLPLVLHLLIVLCVFTMLPDMLPAEL